MAFLTCASRFCPVPVAGRRPGCALRVCVAPPYLLAKHAGSKATGRLLSVPTCLGQSAQISEPGKEQTRKDIAHLDKLVASYTAAVSVFVAVSMCVVVCLFIALARCCERLRPLHRGRVPLWLQGSCGRALGARLEACAGRAA